MLQQTQVVRVIAKYREFIERYPTITDLSKASTADVLRIWKGMGYNRRALYLKKIHSIPATEKELMNLPGVGTYTARAICVFAYRQDIALVDTNIRQIITHFFFDDMPQKENVIQKVADKLLPKGKSWEWHQALMDYGAISLERSRPERSRRTTVPFKNSNRYFRGKLIDVLRTGPVAEHLLVKNFSVSIIDGLIKDGLIERKKGKLRLPE